jgi:hypothetical protein
MRLFKIIYYSTNTGGYMSKIKIFITILLLLVSSWSLADSAGRPDFFTIYFIKNNQAIYLFGKLNKQLINHSNDFWYDKKSYPNALYINSDSDILYNKIHIKSTNSFVTINNKKLIKQYNVIDLNGNIFPSDPIGRDDDRRNLY